MKRQTLKTMAYWMTTVCGPASFVIGGTMFLTRNPQAIEGLAHLGYPAYFATILGVWKLLGAIATVVPGLPRLKEWAYAGFFFNLSAAAFSHAMAGDRAADVAAPLGFLALVIASWLLRPASRRLSNSASQATVHPLPSEPRRVAAVG